MLLLGLATSDRGTAIAALSELDRLRATTRPARRGVRTTLETDDEE
jgi:hypothetical protein